MADSAQIGLKAVLEMSNFQAGMDRYNRAVSGASTATEQKAGIMSRAFSALGTGVLKFGALAAGAALAGATALAGGLVAVALKTAATADELVELSDKTGIGVERLQELKFIGEQTGTSLETVTSSIARMTRNMFTAQDGTGAAADAFKVLGVSVTDSSGNLRDSQTVFNEIINALGGIENETQRDALAMQIFGRSAQELNPLIKAGADGLAGMAQEARDLGAVMSEEAVNTAAEFNDKLAALKMGFEGIVAQVGVAVIPILSQLLDQVIKPMLPIIAQAAQAFGAWLNGILGGGELGGGIGAVSAAFGSFWEFVQPIIAGIGTALTTVWNDFIKPVLDILIQYWQDAIPVALQIVSDFWTNNLLPAIQQLIPVFQENILPLLKQLYEWLKDNIPLAVQAVADFFLDVMWPALSAIVGFIGENVIPIITDMAIWLMENIPPAIQSASDFFNDVLLPAITAIWEFISTSLIPLFEALAELISTVVIVVVENLAVLWRETLQPALETVWAFIDQNILPILEDIAGVISDTLQPALEWLAGFLDKTLSAAWYGIARAIEYVISLINKAIEALQKLRPPAAFDPSSPTPFEVGLLGIAGALGKVTEGIGKMGRSLKDIKWADLEDFFKLGGAFGQFGGAMVGRYQKKVVDPLKASIDAITARQKEIGELLEAGNLEMFQQLGLEAELASLEAERVRLGAEYAEQQKRITELQEQQEDLAFLKSQMDLLKLIKDEGLDIGAILGGLTLGLDADLPSLIEAMTRAIREMVEKANEELDIGSPSGVFRNIGQQIMAGLAGGIQGLIALPEQAMMSALPRLVAPAAAAPLSTNIYRQASVNMGGVVINSDMDAATFQTRVEQSLSRILGV